MRIDSSPFARDLVRPIDDDFRTLFVLLFDAGFFDGLTKLYRRPVHDRHFTLHFDEQIGDTVAVQDGEKVLNGADGESFRAQRSRVARRADVIEMGRQRSRRRKFR